MRGAGFTRGNAVPAQQPRLYSVRINFRLAGNAMSARELNQRDYYRVECRVVLSHRVVGNHIPGDQSPESFFPDNEHFNLLRELRRIDQENNSLLHALSEQNRNLGGYFAVVNRKIDTVARHLAALTPEMSRGVEQSVSLSEAGISFICTPAPKPGDVLAIRLTLLPAWVGLAAYGVVTKVGPDEGDGARTLVGFERLQDADRQIIARHVMQVQMAERKKSGTRS
jgi:hypothetical protein